MHKSLDQSIKPVFTNWQYLVRLGLASTFALILALAGTILLVSYQQTVDYLHPVRQTPSGELLRTNGIEFQQVELVTEDHVRLSAWYTPPQNGAVILVAHGYGDKRTEHYYALFASHGYGVVAWDFRAHGQSEGEFSSLGYYEVLDAKAALEEFRAELKKVAAEVKK